MRKLRNRALFAPPDLQAGAVRCRLPQAGRVALWYLGWPFVRLAWGCVFPPPLLLTGGCPSRAGLTTRGTLAQARASDARRRPRQRLDAVGADRLTAELARWRRLMPGRFVAELRANRQGVVTDRESRHEFIPAHRQVRWAHTRYAAIQYARLRPSAANRRRWVRQHLCHCSGQCRPRTPPLARAVARPPGADRSVPRRRAHGPV